MTSRHTPLAQVWYGTLCSRVAGEFPISVSRDRRICGIDGSRCATGRSLVRVSIHQSRKPFYRFFCILFVTCVSIVIVLHSLYGAAVSALFSLVALLCEAACCTVVWANKEGRKEWSRSTFPVHGQRGSVLTTVKSPVAVCQSLFSQISELTVRMYARRSPREVTPASSHDNSRSFWRISIELRVLIDTVSCLKMPNLPTRDKRFSKEAEFSFDNVTSLRA